METSCYGAINKILPRAIVCAIFATYFGSKALRLDVNVQKKMIKQSGVPQKFTVSDKIGRESRGP